MRNETAQPPSEMTQLEMESTSAGKKRYRPLCHRPETRSGRGRNSRHRRLDTKGLAVLVLLMFLGSIRIAAGNPELDVLVFGDEASESAHDLAAETSEVIEGKTGTPARQIMPSEAHDGMGSMSFTMECHREKRTYLTVKVQADAEDVANPALFDGDDLAVSDSIWEWAFIDRLWAPLIYPYGKATGYSAGTHSEWIYYTSRLPRYMTEGKNNVDLRFVLPPGSDRSFLLYRAYTHTEPLFDLPADEDVVGDYDLGTVGDSLDAEKYADTLIGEINSAVRNLQEGEGDHNPVVALGIASAYQHPDWFDAVEQDAILKIVASAIESYAVEQTEVGAEGLWGPREKTRNNMAWHGHGTLAQAYSLLHEAFEESGLLAETLPEHPEEEITRRKAYTDFFDEALAWRCQNRNIRFYNQSAIITEGLVRMSRALTLLNPERAPDRETVDRWIDEAIGLAPVSPLQEGPFHGDDSVARMLHGKSYSRESVPEDFRVNLNRFLVKDGSYHMATEAGILKEKGEYAMNYGAVGLLHTATMAHETGLQRVKDRVVKAVRAREAMSWWVQNADTGRRWAAVDGTFASRRMAHPGDRHHGYQRRQAPLIWQAAPHEVTRRWAELLLEHGHEPLTKNLTQKIRMVEALRALQKEAEEPSEYVVPMDRQRYVWSDVDLGYVTVIDGNTHMKMQIGHINKTLPAISGITKVHYHGTEGDRVMTIDIDRMDFPFAGQTWELPYELRWRGGGVPDVGEWTELPWRDKPLRIMAALAGKELKLAAKPDGEPWPPAMSRRGGVPEYRDYRATYDIPFRDYRTSLGLHYRQVRVGPYLIGMNSTGAEKRGFGPGEEYDMQVPAPALDLTTGEKITAGKVTVPPRTTRVLKLQTENEN